MPSFLASVHSMVIISRGIELFLFLGRLFFHFLFLLNFDRADAIDGAEGAEAALAQSAFAFQLGLGFDGETGPGDGGQPGFGDVFAGQLANAVGIFLDSF